MTKRVSPPVVWRDDHYGAAFTAMASPCEVLVYLPRKEKKLARRLAALIAGEAWRIEAAYSRYQTGNVHAELHAHPDQRQRVDGETARMLNFGETAWRLSDGLFDLTAGILRKVWKFDGSDRVPESTAVEALLPSIGWDRLIWESDPPQADGNVAGGWLTLPEGMELDFGGIGKEYAVDRALGLGMQLLKGRDAPLLVNFGGDLACSGPRPGNEPWRIGLEAPDRFDQAAAVLALRSGALATSGDSRRFLLKDGRRYSHVLNPHTGWPVPDAPRSVTVAGPTCVQSGLLATLAMLKGADAKAFLEETGLPYQIQ